MISFKASQMHPYTWWVVGLSFAISAAATSEILAVFAIITLAIGVTLAAREGSTSSRSLNFYLATAIAVVIIRLLFRIIFNFDSSVNVAFTLPSLNISLGELGSVDLFGRVSWDALRGALRDGLRMAAIILSVGLANTLANPRKLLRSTPGALYEVASSWVIAINMAPQLIESAKRVRAARLLRGRSSRRNTLSSLIIPVLEDTIDRSLALAASMSARGFGRQGALSQRQLLAVRLVSFYGVSSIAIGSYLLLTMPNPWFAALLIGSGMVAAAATSRLASLRQIRTRYQPEKWRFRDTLICAVATAIAAISLGGWF